MCINKFREGFKLPNPSLNMPLGTAVVVYFCLSRNLNIHIHGFCARNYIRLSQTHTMILIYKQTKKINISVRHYISNNT